jgi:hypothetical protein
VPDQGYELIGRVVWRLAPWVIRRQLAANRDKVVAAGVIVGVVVAGVIVARQEAAAKP